MKSSIIDAFLFSNINIIDHDSSIQVYPLDDFNLSNWNIQLSRIEFKYLHLVSYLEWYVYIVFLFVRWQADMLHKKCQIFES